jgi:LysR family transcriptional regulator (chromosome initiation inhibitor)
MNPDLAQLRAFSAAVEQGTFEAAARSLFLTPSAVSQRIKALETATGRVLLHRTKPVRVTGSGKAILLLARQIETLLADASQRLGVHGTHRPSIPIAVNADSLATWAMPALAAVAGSFSLDIHREDEAHTTALLCEGRVMAAITSVSRAVQGCSVTRLGAMRYRAMAPPAFIERWFPHGPTAAALERAPVVVFDRVDDLQDRFLRRRARRRMDPPRSYVPSSTDYTEAVRCGIGWGLVPDLQSEDHEHSGRLVDLSPGESVEVKLYWQQWRLSSAALEQLASAVVAAADRGLR